MELGLLQYQRGKNRERRIAAAVTQTGIIDVHAVS